MLKQALLASLMLAVAHSTSFAQDFSKGYFTITSMSTEKNNGALEGNKVVQGNYLGGVSFMAKSDGSTGQQWKFISAGNGYYFLTTRFVENDGLRLEGNNGDPNSGVGHSGVPFMTPKGDFSGQYWKITPSTSKGYYHLTTMFVEKQGMRLEARVLNPTKIADAPHMEKARNLSGQFWKITPVKN